jgi:hypothetical protein
VAIRTSLTGGHTLISSKEIDMRTIQLAVILILAGAVTSFGQEATPPPASMSASTTTDAFAAPAPKPQPSRRRFRLVRAAAHVVREVHAQTGLSVPMPTATINNEIAVGALAGLGLGGLAFQDCDPRVSPCTAAILISGGVGAVSGAIVRAHRKD